MSLETYGYIIQWSIENPNIPLIYKNQIITEDLLKNKIEETLKNFTINSYELCIDKPQHIMLCSGLDYGQGYIEEISEDILEEDMIYISNILKDPRCLVKSVIIRSCGFHTKLFNILVDALIENKSVIEVDIDYNNISNVDPIMFSNLFIRNNTIKMFYFGSYHNVSKKQCIVLRDFINKIPNINARYDFWNFYCS